MSFMPVFVYWCAFPSDFGSACALEPTLCA